MSRPFVVACIPAYDEEQSIGSVVVRATKYVDKIIVCDDRSNDLTAEIAEGLGAIVLKHNRNLGKGAALRTAFHYVSQLKPDVIVMLDGDGQHNPDEIPKLIKPILEENAKMVIGTRFSDHKSTEVPLYRKIGLTLINYLSRQSQNIEVKDTQCGFRAFNTEVLDIMKNLRSDGYGVEIEQLVLATKFGIPIVEVPITLKYKDLNKTSKKNPVYHGFELLDTLLTLFILERPLMLIAFPGTLLLIAGIGFFIYFLLYFNHTGLYLVNVALMFSFLIFLGVLFIITSIVLYAINATRMQ